jgi:hypothetical protein
MRNICQAFTVNNHVRSFDQMEASFLEFNEDVNLIIKYSYPAYPNILGNVDCKYNGGIYNGIFEENGNSGIVWYRLTKCGKSVFLHGGWELNGNQNEYGYDFYDISDKA